MDMGINTWCHIRIAPGVIPNAERGGLLSPVSDDCLVLLHHRGISCRIEVDGQKDDNTFMQFKGGRIVSLRVRRSSYDKLWVAWADLLHNSVDPGEIDLRKIEILFPAIGFFALQAFAEAAIVIDGQGNRMHLGIFGKVFKNILGGYSGSFWV